MKKRIILTTCLLLLLVSIGGSSSLAAPSTCPNCGASMNVSYGEEYDVYVGDKVIGNQYFYVYQWRRTFTARCTAYPSSHVSRGYDVIRSEYRFIGYI